MRGCGWGGRCCACACSCVGGAEGAQYRAHILERLWCDVKRDGLMLFVHPLPRLPTAISSTKTRSLSTASPGTMWPDEMLFIAHVKGMGSPPSPCRPPSHRCGGSAESRWFVLHGLQHGVPCCNMLCCSTLYYVASCNIPHCVCNMVRDTSDGSSRTSSLAHCLPCCALASASLHVVC